MVKIDSFYSCVLYILYYALINPFFFFYNKRLMNQVANDTWSIWFLVGWSTHRSL